MGEADVFWLNVTNVALAVCVLALVAGMLIAALADIARGLRRRHMRPTVWYRRRWRLS